MLPWFWKYQVLGIPSPLTKSKRNTANAAERTAEGPRSLTWSLASLVRARCAKILEPKVEKGDFGGSGWVDIYHRVSVPISESLLTIMDQHIYVYYHLKIWVLLFSSKQGCFIVNINQRCLFQRLAVLQWVRRLKLTKKNTFDVSPHIRLQPLSFTVSQRTPIFGGAWKSTLAQIYSHCLIFLGFQVPSQIEEAYQLWGEGIRSWYNSFPILFSAHDEMENAAQPSSNRPDCSTVLRINEVLSKITPGIRKLSLVLICGMWSWLSVV